MNFSSNLFRSIFFLTMLFPALALFAEGGKESVPVAELRENERISDLEVGIVIHRDGMVSVESRFRLGVGGGVIKRGPVLRYLTAFQGPGGLILDNGMEIEAVLRDGVPEPFHLEKSDGFLVLFVGSPEVELEHGEYTYTVRHRTESDWRRNSGEFSAAIDVLGPLPRVPIDQALVRVEMPEGVAVSRFSPAVTGFESGGEGGEPGYEASPPGTSITVTTTRPLSVDRSFFLNLTWPSATFTNQSLWIKVMAQHPRLPLAAFSAVMLLWALVLILARASRRRVAPR